MYKHNRSIEKNIFRVRRTLLFVIFLGIAVIFFAGGHNNFLTHCATPVAFSDLIAQKVIEETGAEEWDFVIIGDSVTWGFSIYYARALKEDLGVKIKIHNWSEGSGHSSDLLNRLRESILLREAIKGAEVIIFEIPWNVVKTPCMTFMGGIGGLAEGCGGEDNQDCLREAFEIYKSDATQIIEEITSLRSPCEAIIRTMDTYQLSVYIAKEKGAFDVINMYWQDANRHVIEEAAKYNIPAAKVYDAFMGEDGMGDPMDKGLVYDGNHTTQEGINLMVEVFRNIGYAYAPEE